MKELVKTMLSNEIKGYQAQWEYRNTGKQQVNKYTITLSTMHIIIMTT